MTAPERPAPERPAAGNEIPARLDFLTSLRFFAAAFVVMGHTQSSDTYTSATLKHVFAFPFAAVTFFFVLSGFVLVWSARPADTPRRFYVRRFARVWPLYALVTVLLLPIGWTIRYPSWSFGDYMVVWVAVLLAVQSLSPFGRHQEAVNPPNWSLSVEAFFYLLFPALRELSPETWDAFSEQVIATTPPVGAHLMVGFLDQVGTAEEVEIRPVRS